MADIPGLIEGASHGVGLGHDFLRHIMRAGILVHLIEPMPMDGTDPIENYLAIRKELTEYSSELANRPEIIAMTKSELPDSQSVLDRLKETTGRDDVLMISAVTGQGLNILTHRIADLLAQQPKLAKPGT